MELANYNKIYFVGIGGIGVSALARIMLELGKKVFGSDISSSEITDELKRLGVAIHIGEHSRRNITNDIDLVIYSNAVKPNNPEIQKARKLKIPVISYPEFLGGLMKSYLPIVVSGTHGKSTTTAMLATIFIAAGLDPTVVIGSKLQEINSNARLGLGKYFIVEGDEYKEAFLHYHPIAVIINNIEADHLDYFKSELNVVRAFWKLAKRIPVGGFLIAKSNDKNIQKIIKKVKCRVITFGLGEGDYYISNIVQQGELTRFSIRGLESFDLAIRVPGRHNAENALAAAVAALAFGIDHKIIKQALLRYSGIWRRFEIKGRKRGIVIVDDYAHHPTEIKETLKTARQYFPERRLWCIFQPHSIHRTKMLFDDFVSSFNDCDNLILTDIYRVAGRDNRERAMIERLAEKISGYKENVFVVKSLSKVTPFVAHRLKRGDVVITMGAGTITTVSDKLLSSL